MSNISSREYWGNYYKNNKAPHEPSPFAQYVAENHLPQEPTNIVEFGSGNARDAKFFASLGHRVLAFDQCNADLSPNGTNPSLLFGDFTRLPDLSSPTQNVYSRFTLHSVDASGQERALKWAQRNLADNGQLLIETRGQQNEYFQLGEQVPGEEDAFIYQDHYRRFVDLNQFVDDVEKTGFRIVDAQEATGFAPFKGDDHQFIRVIARKD